MIYRIDVQIRLDHGQTDPLGRQVRHQMAEFGISVGEVSSRRVFLIDAEATEAEMKRAAAELLADPIVETADLFTPARSSNGQSRIEIHLKPGVMDPVAASTEMALRDLGIQVREVRTGRAFLIAGHVNRAELERIASRVLANGVIESVHFEPFLPARFEAGREYRFQLRHVTLRDLTDEQLVKMSRQGHLFLSLAEMKAVQHYFRQQEREPTDIELETIAQTWSEHCVHKTLKSAVDVVELDEAGREVGRRHYGNLIKETIFDSTMRLIDSGKKNFCLSVFADNAGVIAFDENEGVCFKVETHNHPSAIEPYGGSATGAGGVIRDILGTGLGARPVANTDIFCVAFPDGKQTLPRGVIHPRRVLQQVVAGVRDYGNRMGIPTVNGAVYFDDRFLGNPLVFCGCVGMIPRNRIAKAARPGDAIVVMGGRTGRDGIHGATFSSAELTDTHADEFSHAVQIGNAITEKKMADVVLAARDRGLFTAITDCGAGGLSSAVGEMGEKTGATVELDRVPLKYPGLGYDEVWISEAQERMVLAVPPEHVRELLELAGAEDVEATIIGSYGTERKELILHYRGTEVGRMAMRFLHDGIPTPVRKAVVRSARKESQPAGNPLSPAEFKSRLLSLLKHPNIASKHWIIRQYDHEVQGGSVVKPLTGPLQLGPSDAAVIRPNLSTRRGVVLSCGLCPAISDPYNMAIASIDEAIRNAVAVGADPARLAILDNFCWPSVDDEATMGTLVRACEACRDAAITYGIPFISGKDSLHNQFTNQETGEVLRIPNTLLISAIGVIDDVSKCVTMDRKQADSRLVLLEAANPADLKNLSETHRLVASLIHAGDVLACHDVSDGGIAVAAAEMCLAAGMNFNVGPELLNESAFTETPGRYLLEVPGEIPTNPAYKVTLLSSGAAHIDSHEMTAAWRGTLDW